MVAQTISQVITTQVMPCEASPQQNWSERLEPGTGQWRGKWGWRFQRELTVGRDRERKMVEEEAAMDQNQVARRNSK